MKKWIICGLIGVLTAGLAVAENTNTVPWYKKLFNKNADEQTQVIPPAPAATPAPAVSAATAPAASRMPSTPEQKAKFEKMKAQATPEQKAKFEKMKAQREEIMKLGEAARNETDPAKKEVLVAELRAKLTEIADKMQAEAKKRIAQAGEETGKLQQKVADYEKNKPARIEEQVQRILAGQSPYPSEGKHPDGASLKKDGKKGVKPPAAK